MSRSRLSRSLLVTVFCFLISAIAVRFAYCHDINAWLIASGAHKSWQKINASDFPGAQLRFGDFDGDGKTDVFTASGGKWLVSVAKDSGSMGGTGKWKDLNTSSIGFADLGFGDFDGDGKTDVFATWGGRWYVSVAKDSESVGGTSGWLDLNTYLNTLPFGLDELRFGDFDGDGKADVFTTFGGRWLVSVAKDPQHMGGTSDWKHLTVSDFVYKELRFGDFDGDGKTDVFATWGGRWYVSVAKDSGSMGATSDWLDLNTLPFALAKLRFGDFDGDGKTDVFTTSGGKWLVSVAKDSGSMGGTSDWKVVGESRVPLAYLRFGDFDGFGTMWPPRHPPDPGEKPRYGDFDGDKKTDIFRVAPERHVGLFVGRFTTSVLTDADADRILADATSLLQTNDGGDDEACLIHFARIGFPLTLTIGNGSINSQADIDALEAVSGGDTNFVWVLNQINFCGGRIIPNVVGCAPTPGNYQMVVRTVPNLEGVVWAHEYGHTRGLDDSEVANALMNGTAAVTNTRVNALECFFVIHIP